MTMASNTPTPEAIEPVSVLAPSSLPPPPLPPSEPPVVVLQNDNYENHFFYEDEVLKFDRNGRVKFGLVIEAYEAGSSDTESDMDLVVKKGEIRVAWHPEGIEEVIAKRYVGLADRTLMPGDVVRRCSPGKHTQKGYCREVQVSADVRIKGTDYVAKNVTSSRLRPLITMLRDNAVCLDSWVGSTTSIVEKIILKTSCGSILELRPDHEFCPLKDADTKYRHGFFAGTLFYPGQTLIGPISALENAKWIHTTPEIRNPRNTRSTTFVVQSVEIEGVDVHWQCKALSNGQENDLKETQPSSYVSGSDLAKLRRLNLFESCMLQINDKNYLTIEEQDIANMTNKSQWRKERSTCYENYKILHNQIKAECGNQKPVKLQIHECIDKCPIAPSRNDTTMGIDKKSHFGSKIKLTKHNVTTACVAATSEMMAGDDVKNHLESTIAKMFRRFENSYSSKLTDSDGWKTDDDSNSCSDSLTTASSCSSPTPKSSPKRSPALAKKMKKFKKRHTKKLKNTPPKIGEELVTETIVVYSNATVVWQDGTIETCIPSRQLYPIHHLDEHEFFPGDFVLAGSESNNLSYRDYGVIQKVDHRGRTALVKWFRTYTSPENPRPQFFNETEVSVYDLKDHPDFQYRPGTIVIRVANFIGEDKHCTAGQVVDNYPDGLVKVWWVDGHYSMCWPQDLFEVGQYDADHNLWLSCDSDNDSWETESERSEPGSPTDTTIKPQLAKNLDRARAAMIQLEEMISMNPGLERKEVMRKLLEVYKKCRFMDRLLNTSFFHEDNFMGLIERVRRGSVTSTAARVQDHKNRLFNEFPPSNKSNLPSNESAFCLAVHKPSTVKSKHYKVTPKTTDSNDSMDMDHTATTLEQESCHINVIDEYTDDPLNVFDNTVTATLNKPQIQKQTAPLNSLVGYAITNIDTINREAEDINNCLTIIQNYVQCQKMQDNCSAHDDSGNHTKSEWGEASYCSSTDITTDTNSSLQQPNPADDQTSNSCFSMELANDDLSEFVCARLSALIKTQLIKAFNEINSRISQPSNLSDVQKVDGKNEQELVENENKQSMEHNSIEIAQAAVIEDLNQSTITSDKTPVDEMDDMSLNSSVVISSVPSECFLLSEKAPPTHMFSLSIFEPRNAQQFFKAVRFDHKLLKTALPPGVWVRLYEDRVDLLSVMIEGPKKTPYEDGLFLFDIQLGKDYPQLPPSCHYISYCTDRLNPNLYENGKVCISLLGTWSGRDSELWSPVSTLLQVIVSIQGLILVSEPYFNEAGYEKQKGTQQGSENSRMYNEMVILKLIQSMSKLLTNPSEVFAEQINRHFCQQGIVMYDRIKNWMDMSIEHNANAAATKLACAHSTLKESNNDPSSVKMMINSDNNCAMPEFSLIPASRGFCITLAGLLENFRNKLIALHTQQSQSSYQQQEVQQQQQLHHTQDE